MEYQPKVQVRPATRVGFVAFKQGQDGSNRYIHAIEAGEGILFVKRGAVIDMICQKREDVYPEDGQGDLGRDTFDPLRH
jgi:hypothetical protein